LYVKKKISFYKIFPGREQNFLRGIVGARGVITARWSKLTTAACFIPRNPEKNQSAAWFVHLGLFFREYDAASQPKTILYECLHKTWQQLAWRNENHMLMSGEGIGMCCKGGKG